MRLTVKSRYQQKIYSILGESNFINADKSLNLDLNKNQFNKIDIKLSQLVKKLSRKEVKTKEFRKSHVIPLLNPFPKTT